MGAGDEGVGFRDRLNLGTVLFFAASAALGVVQLTLGSAVPGLDDSVGPVGDILAMLLLASSVLSLTAQTAALGARALVLSWATIAIINLYSALREPLPLTNWVAFVETGLFAIAAATRASRSADAGLAGRLFPTLAAVTLALFGVIHLVEHQALTSLVPEWLPSRSVAPLFTGASQLALAGTLLTPHTRRFGAFAAAALFASWLPLVHAGRLATSPASAFEWGFALTALALIGAMLQVGQHGRRSSSAAVSDES